VDSKEAEPRPVGMVIIFSNVNCVQRTSNAEVVLARSSTPSGALELTVHFINDKTGKELNRTEITVSSKGNRALISAGFEGRANNSVVNLVNYIIEKVK
jgi:hypothetical protein